MPLGSVKLNIAAPLFSLGIGWHWRAIDASPYCTMQKMDDKSAAQPQVDTLPPVAPKTGKRGRKAEAEVSEEVKASGPAASPLVEIMQNNVGDGGARRSRRRR